MLPIVHQNAFYSLKILTTCSSYNANPLGSLFVAAVNVCFSNVSRYLTTALALYIFPVLKPGLTDIFFPAAQNVDSETWDFDSEHNQWAESVSANISQSYREKSSWRSWITFSFLTLNRRALCSYKRPSFMPRQVGRKPSHLFSLCCKLFCQTVEAK